MSRKKNKKLGNTPTEEVVLDDVQEENTPEGAVVDEVLEESETPVVVDETQPDEVLEENTVQPEAVAPEVEADTTLDFDPEVEAEKDVAEVVAELKTEIELPKLDRPVWVDPSLWNSLSDVQKTELCNGKSIEEIKNL